jgi:hypothetical protein
MMASPVFVTRGNPTGIPWPNGYRTLIAFAIAPAVMFWEKSVKPPKVDGGKAIDTTTMLNVNFKTKRPSALIEVADLSVTASYDNALYNYILINMLNVEGSICVTHPNGLQQAFFGWLMAADPTENKEGTQPDVKLDICVSNWDPINNVESGMIFKGGTPANFRPAAPPKPL